MKVLYNFDNISKMKRVFINQTHNPCLPFSMNYWMFKNLCNLERPLTDSELYDKCILEQELWNRMCSQILREYMSCDYYHSAEKEEVSYYG